MSTGTYEPILFLALGLCAVSLLLSILSLYRTASFERKLARFRRSLRNKENGEQTDRMEEMEAELEVLKRRMASLEEQPVPRERRTLEMPASVPAFASAPARSAPRSAALLEHEYHDFVSEYNKLQHAPASDLMSARKMRDEFSLRFSVRAFRCTNYTQRMSDPAVPPIFADEPNLTKAQYWAFLLSDGSYAVVPNVKTYEERIHSAAGMKEAFRSNYMEGTTYRDITVLRPAIFSAGQALQAQGELRLR